MKNFNDLRSDWEDRVQEITSFMFVDVDDLKIVNSKFGWLAGNALVSRITCLLSGAFKNVYRIGGDEFVVVNDPFSEKVIDDLNRKCDVKFSAGLVDFKLKTLEEYINTSDAFCRYAKGRGKQNCFRA